MEEQALKWQAGMQQQCGKLSGCACVQAASCRSCPPVPLCELLSHSLQPTDVALQGCCILPGNGLAHAILGVQQHCFKVSCILQGGIQRRVCAADRQVASAVHMIKQDACNQPECLRHLQT